MVQCKFARKPFFLKKKHVHLSRNSTKNPIVFYFLRICENFLKGFCFERFFKIKNPFKGKTLEENFRNFGKNVFFLEKKVLNPGRWSEQ